MNVVSLFDGMSNGHIALDRAGIKVDAYYASEIKQHSINITQKNYPNTIQIGDVTKIHYPIFPEIHLLIAGSPCQNLSVTAIDRKDVASGLKGEKSILFFEFVKALKILRPNYFLLENVASMPEADKKIITELLEVEPIMINSNLVSAQDRERYYWTNIPSVTQPEDKGILLRDIMEPEVDEKYYINKPFEFYGLDKKVCGELKVNTTEMCRRVYNPNFKCGTLTVVQGGYQEKKVYDKGRVRKLTPTEYERLQTVPEGYTAGVADGKRYSMLGDGWTVDVIAHIFKGLKAGVIDAN